MTVCAFMRDGTKRWETVDPAALLGPEDEAGIRAQLAAKGIVRVVKVNVVQAST